MLRCNNHWTHLILTQLQLKLLPKLKINTAEQLLMENIKFFILLGKVGMQKSN